MLSNSPDQDSSPREDVLDAGDSSDCAEDMSDASTVRITPGQARLREALGTRTRSHPDSATQPRQVSALNDSSINPSSQRTASLSDEHSRKSLLDHNGIGQGKQPDSTTGRVLPTLLKFTHETPEQVERRRAMTSGPISSEGTELQHKLRRRNQKTFGTMLRNPFMPIKSPGQLLRSERMLLRVEFAREGSVPDDYSETKAVQVSRKVDMHWREFILAARADDAGLVVLNFHRNRSLPVVAKFSTTAKPTVRLTLDPKTTKASLYSSLDKTIAIWQKSKKGTMIYILRPCTSHSSIEWYAFIQTRLNVRPRSVATIVVPNLNTKLTIELAKSSSNEPRDSDTRSTSSRSSSHSSDGVQPDTLELNEAGQIISAGVPVTIQAIIKKCCSMLSENTQWASVLQEWKTNERLGLCWRRYDRLEWVHGHSAQQLIALWAMRSTHELELRPKEHYATQVLLPSGKMLHEPAPIEGFLVRLTSSVGRQARFGKVFYKRLYFSTHDNLLFYSSPGAATPPPPPAFKVDDMAQAEQALAKCPLMYDVIPYPVRDGQITWLQSGTSAEEMSIRNQIALTEGARRVSQLQVSEGFIDLALVVRIRRCKVTDEDLENNIDHSGEDVPFHVTGEEAETVLESGEGITNEFDDERVFELVLRTGLVIRLQAFDATTRQAWMDQLKVLIDYWTWRHKADASEYRKVRKANLNALQIDEELEGLVGQYGAKWEVAHCVAEPQIYNFCPISSCRTIALRGVLYRKPRVHATFRKYDCMISHGQLLIYNYSHWSPTGDETPHIHQSRKKVIDLKHSYVYSGMVATTELIGARETSDREGPGRHALPRLYQDGWTSQDEQEALCFVMWTARRRKAFLGVDTIDVDETNNSVSRLGVPGRSMVYMARSRQERDLWVQVLGNEIERSYSCGTV